LAPSREQDEDNLDPFLQQESDESPQVPPKDIKYQQNLQQPTQPFAAQLHQEPYIRPPLGRVSTEGSYSTQGGVDQYSPEQHQGQGAQQQQQQQPTQQQIPRKQQPYHTYQPTAQNSQGSTNFQSYIPQNAPSPLPQSTQLHGQSAPAQDIQQNYYQYQQQQQQPPPVHNQPSLESSQQNLHPQQQPHFASQLQPQPDQRQQPQTALSASQLQTEVQHPQAIRQQHPQIVPQTIEPQQSQQRRPPSSHQLAPPSPLQPTPYQHHESQQAKHSQSSDIHTLNNASHQQGQEGMTPSGQGNSRSTVRKVNEGSQPQPGAPSQESSQLQPPSAQGQTLGQPPVSPGLATFDANVVPTASQGQPYRAEKQGQQASDMGRATPPPRASASEMTEEEVEKMIKEHEVLRKYHAPRERSLRLTICR
jgi:hypothetical protein